MIFSEGWSECEIEEMSRWRIIRFAVPTRNADISDSSVSLATAAVESVAAALISSSAMATGS